MRIKFIKNIRDGSDDDHVRGGQFSLVVDWPYIPPVGAYIQGLSAGGFSVDQIWCVGLAGEVQAWDTESVYKTQDDCKKARLSLLDDGWTEEPHSSGLDAPQ